MSSMNKKNRMIMSNIEQCWICNTRVFSLSRTKRTL